MYVHSDLIICVPDNEGSGIEKAATHTNRHTGKQIKLTMSRLVRDPVRLNRLRAVAMTEVWSNCDVLYGPSVYTRM